MLSDSTALNTVTPGIVLHVDDELVVRQAVALLLQPDGYEVHGAASGAEALRLAGGGLRPDVLIADFNLDEDLNGAELAEQLPKVLGYSPPVIMLSGDLSNAEVPAITSAPVWFTRKPLNAGLLLAALPGLVQMSRATRSQQRTLSC